MSMLKPPPPSPAWPALPLESWRDTRDTVQMWTQIAGKICLALTPRVNHFWNIAFQVTARGFITPALPHGPRTFTMAFDFVAHELTIETSDGARETIPLRPQTVADFYRAIMERLRALQLETRIWTMPVEFQDPIRFEQDLTHRSYDADAVQRFHGALLAMKPVFDAFRAEFIGKCSPVHFFWGSFDLAVTRFSGRPAPPRPDADLITREGYSHEVSSVGWWPGDSRLPQASFYSYAAPEPDGFRTSAVSPAATYYNESLSGFYLHYDDLRRAVNPEQTLLDFCRSTYEAAAEKGKWDRASLERP